MDLVWFVFQIEIFDMQGASMNPPFVMAPCPDKGGRMIMATRDIGRGEVILEREWMQRTTFIVATEEEAKEHAAHTGGPPPQVSFDAQDAAALQCSGSAISRVFAPFASAANLQMTCSLIEHHSWIVQQWVKEGDLYVDRSPAVRRLSLARASWRLRALVVVYDLLTLCEQVRAARPAQRHCPHGPGAPPRVHELVETAQRPAGLAALLGHYRAHYQTLQYGCIQCAYTR